ncbi:ABC transporter substrate-binding protein [Microvirga pudoricolor]|uniref:ABC transporter substrate-binding protein n=1 Tax=Microvirga pudoricolor TaxID=2778729 RepID=UPI001950E540|nr:ABC transporter substrate-binding protein [Microvirga pudoricolor]MBM6595604.1 ABC transporter substrate-binding protein [Microvirga pudoricolor]
MKITQIALAAAALSCMVAGAQAETTAYPLAVENCGRTLTFQAAPTRVVTVGQSTTEMLFALGLADRVVGTSVWFNDVLPEFGDANGRIPRLADNHPGFESVAAKRPQLVTTQFEVHVGPQGIVGKPEQFREIGIQTYAMPADCVGKDNLTGGDGTRKTRFTIDTVYKAIDDLSAIFDVPDRGKALKADLQARVAKATERAASLNLKDASAVFWFSSADIDLDPYVAGQKGIPGYIMNTLGIRNVVQSDEEWPTVGWETIVKADPSVIVIMRMDRRRFPADDVEKKLQFLKTDPVASQMSAVKQGRIVIVDAHAIHASIRIATGIEAMVDAMTKIGAAP